VRLLDRFRRHKDEPVVNGPLYAAVREVMVDVQAYARSHGGDIELVSVDDEGLVTIRLKGTCRGCPLSVITVKTGVEQRLKLLVPGVSGIRQI